MALSTIYTWLVLGAGLGILYFLACGVTEERIVKDEKSKARLPGKPGLCL